MSIDASLNTTHLRRISLAVARACLAVAIGLPVAVLLYGLFADAAGLVAQVDLPGDALQAPLQTWQRASVVSLSELPAVLVSIGLWQARRCFLAFAQGEVFTDHAVDCLRRFATWIAASAVAQLIVSPISSVLLTMGNPPGSRHLSIAISSDHVMMLLFAAIVWLMSAVIGQGRALADENAGFV